MTDDDQISRALHEAVSDIEPRDTLGEIRARTRSGSTDRRGWPLVLAGAVATAAIVATFAVVSNGSDPESEPGPAAGSTSTPLEPSQAKPSPTSAPSPGRATAVYCVGETPQGPRLYREFRPAPADTRDDPLDAARVLLMETPSDPDYGTLWPQGSIVDTSFDGIGSEGQASVVLADASYAERPAGMTGEEATMAVQQLVYTVQAALRTRAPVGFVVPGGTTLPTVLGVPTTEPLVEGEALGTLAHVNISDPAEGVAVEDELVVSGAANSFESNLAWTISDADHNQVLDGSLMAEGYLEPRLFPFSGTIDVRKLAAGTYILEISSDDPSGDGISHTDTRTFVVE